MHGNVGYEGVYSVVCQTTNAHCNHANAPNVTASLEGHSSTVYSVAFDGIGGTLASGSDDHTVKVWDVATGECLRTLEGAGGRVLACAGGTLASGSADQTVKVWDAATGECLRTLEGHSDPVWSVAFDPSGGTLASGSWDQTVKVWVV